MDREAPIIRDLLGKIEKEDMKAPIDGNDKEILKWIKKRMGGKPTGQLDTACITSYNPDEGFAVQVLGIHGFKGVKSPMKAIYSLNPPASFYQEPKYTADVGFTKHYNWELGRETQSFVDDMYKWKGQPFHPNLLLIVDVKYLDLKKGEMNLIDAGWTVIPIFNEKGHVNHGAFRLPVFTGTPTLVS